MKKVETIKFIVLSFIALVILAFVYSLGFFTNFLQIRGSYRELYDGLQGFNRNIFNYSFFMVLGAGLLYVFDSHRTNQYSIVNKLIGVLNGIAGLGLSWFVMSKIPHFKSEYLKINLEDILMYYPDYKISVFAFDIGNILFTMMIISSIILIIASLVNKKA